MTIRTHHQRRRVLVSSTPRELAPERAAARQVIEDLNMMAVMLETDPGVDPSRVEGGADLQPSDIFVGLYWQRYGQVAPDEEISRLEDEYRRSAGVPRLLYVKEPAFRREPRLANTAEGYAPRPDYRPQTKFETRGLKLGHGVWDVIFRRH